MDIRDYDEALHILKKYIKKNKLGEYKKDDIPKIAHEAKDYMKNFAYENTPDFKAPINKKKLDKIKTNNKMQAYHDEIRNTKTDDEIQDILEDFPNSERHKKYLEDRYGKRELE